jgi:hypothetical protein
MQGGHQTQLVELPPFFKAMEILSCTMVQPLLFGTLALVPPVVLEAKEIGSISPVPTLCAHARLTCASLLIYLVEE